MQQFGVNENSCRKEEKVQKTSLSKTSSSQETLATSTSDTRSPKPTSSGCIFLAAYRTLAKTVDGTYFQDLSISNINECEDMEQCRIPYKFAIDLKIRSFIESQLDKSHTRDFEEEVGKIG